MTKLPAPGGKLAILSGGGPAPGINSVIGAATIRACLSGAEVLGIHDGYKWLLRGDTSKTTRLTIESTSRIHFRGGSAIGISREGPGSDPRKIAKVAETLRELEVDKLIAIGGDGTGTAAAAISRHTGGALRVVHVPKTIDNDIDLPEEAPTFGFQTARHNGAAVVHALMVDAKATSRWFFVVTMGRKAGHLALGIGKSVGATITLIPEEFRGVRATTTLFADILAGSIIKRLAHGRSDGIAVLAEGLVSLLDPEELASLGPVARDAYGRVSLGEVPYGDILKRRVEERLRSFGISTPIVSKTMGYELRSGDPVPFDTDLTRDLGYGAAKLLLEGGGGATITMQRGRLTAIPIADMCDPKTGRMRLRMVDIDSDRYRVARTYMIRLRPEDFEGDDLARLAETASLTPEQFRDQLFHTTRGEASLWAPPRVSEGGP